MYVCVYGCMQLHRGFRKPLIVMSPKNLLRHKECKSNISEFDDVEGRPGFDKQGTRFKRLIKDSNDHSDLENAIRRLVLCSGKVSLPLNHFEIWVHSYKSRSSFPNMLFNYNYEYLICVADLLRT